MEILRIVVTVLFAIDALVLAVIVLMQEGKSAGLTGTISGMADTYWGKNKGRSMEGKLGGIHKNPCSGFLCSGFSVEYELGTLIRSIR